MQDQRVIELREDESGKLIDMQVAPDNATSALRLQIARQLKKKNQVSSCYALEKLIDESTGETSTADKYDMYYH